VYTTAVEVMQTCIYQAACLEAERKGLPMPPIPAAPPPSPPGGAADPKLALQITVLDLTKRWPNLVIHGRDVCGVRLTDLSHLTLTQLCIYRAALLAAKRDDQSMPAIPPAPPTTAPAPEEEAVIVGEGTGAVSAGASAGDADEGLQRALEESVATAMEERLQRHRRAATDKPCRRAAQGCAAFALKGNYGFCGDHRFVNVNFSENYGFCGEQAAAAWSVMEAAALERRQAAAASASASGDHREQAAAASASASVCSVCLDSEPTCVFVPCGHKCTCRGCADAIMATEQKQCPLCRTASAMAVTVFE